MDGLVYCLQLVEGVLVVCSLVCVDILRLYVCQNVCCGGPHIIVSTRGKKIRLGVAVAQVVVVELLVGVVVKQEDMHIVEPDFLGCLDVYRAGCYLLGFKRLGNKVEHNLIGTLFRNLVFIVKYSAPCQQSHSSYQQ